MNNGIRAAFAASVVSHDDWARYDTPVLAVGVGALIGTLVKTGRWVPGLEPEVSQGGSAIALSWRLPVAF